MRPLIGITGRALALGMVADTSPRFHEQRIHTYFTAFADGVAAAGGVPIAIPFAAPASDVVAHLDGLIVTGGQDVHPARWGGRAEVDPTADPRWDHDVHDAERDAYEAALIGAALECGTAVLGVCRGHQLLNVVLGGTLVEHLEDGEIVHAGRYAAPSDGDAAHVVEFVPGTWAHEVYGPRRVVNSWHHQAVDVLGDGLVVAGRTADGVVESIALGERPVVGVQWHPEWSATQPDLAFGWLVAECSRTSRKALA